MRRGKRESVQAGRGHRQGRGQRRGPSRGRGRGLIDENASLSLHSRVGDTNISLSVPHELSEGHHSQQSFDPIDSAAALESQGAASTASSSTSVRRVTGRNKCSKLNKMVAKHGPIMLDIPARHQTPVGENASMFATKIGELVWNMCELYHDSWTEVPYDVKDALANHFNSYIRLEIEDCNVDSNAVDYKMSCAYSRIRSNLYRKHYKKHFEGIKESDEVAMAIAKVAGRAEIVDGIDPANWSLICDSYDRDEWKKKSKRNAENRSKCETNHTAETCSFVNKIHKRKRETGSTPGPAAFYKDTHTKKDGTFVNSICENLHNKMIELTDGGDMVREQEVVTQVLGGPRSFYVRGMGCGLIPTPSSSFKRNSFAWSKIQEFLINELRETKSQLEELNAKIAKLEEKQEKMEKTLEMILSRLGELENLSKGFNLSKTHIK